MGPPRELARVDGTTDEHRDCSEQCCAPGPRGPSHVQVHHSQLQWLSSLSEDAPLFQSLSAAGCQDKLEAVGITRMG